MTDPPRPATSFKVAAVHPPNELVWAKPDSSWSWRLTPVDADHTRVVTRLKQRYRARPDALLTIPLLELGDFPMMRAMLKGIALRSERAHRTPSVRRTP
jgi:hypothetical protein